MRKKRTFPFSHFGNMRSVYPILLTHKESKCTLIFPHPHACIAFDIMYGSAFVTAHIRKGLGICVLVKTKATRHLPQLSYFINPPMSVCLHRQSQSITLQFVNLRNGPPKSIPPAPFHDNRETTTTATTATWMSGKVSPDEN